MKYIILILCFTLTAMSVDAKTTLDIKLKSGERVTGYYKMTSAFSKSKILLKDVKSGETIPVERDNIESILITESTGEKYKFQSFKATDNYFSSESPEFFEDMGQVLVASENAELYLTYDASLAGDGSKALEVYYIYLPKLGYGVKVHMATEINLSITLTEKLLQLLGDDNSIRAKIENKQYSRKELDKLIVQYNRNAGYNSKVYEISKKYRF